MSYNIPTSMNGLAKKWKICYEIPVERSIQFLDCNKESQLVKFALNGDFAAQNTLAKKLKELLNIKL